MSAAHRELGAALLRLGAAMAQDVARGHLAVARFFLTMKTRGASHLSWVLWRFFAKEAVAWSETAAKLRDEAQRREG